MAKHFKERKRAARGPIVALIAVVAVLAVLGGCFAIGNTEVLQTLSSLFKDKNPAEVPTTRPTTTTTMAEPEPEPQYAVPESMKGFWLTAGIDYLKKENESADTVRTQIDAAFSSVDDWAFNTVLVPLHTGTTALYPTNLMDCVSLQNSDGTAFEPLKYIVQKAREKQLFVYGVLDMHVRDGEDWDPRKDGVTDRTVRIAKEAVGACDLDGVFLANAAFTADQITADGREEAVTALNTLMTAVTTALKEDRDRYIGLMSYGIWAHKTTDERGSDTAQYYEEFTDGAADTLKWVNDGLFHCVMVKNYSSTAHPTAAFQNVLSWWNTVAETANLPLFVSHSANTLGSYLAGWQSPDQLAQQYLYCKDAASYRGSAYDSISALQRDVGAASTALKKAYEGALDESFIYNQLTVSFPPKTTYTTTESSITLQGGGDTNFPLTMNGEELALSEHGFFTKKVTLSIGLNTFKFAHKGKTRVVEITYKQTLITNVSPSKDMTVDGESIFLIRATARRGSKVTAVINGVTVTLSPTDDKQEESGGAPSDFQGYVGKYTLPKGKIGKPVSLGAVKVTAKYNGLSETKTGGKITIEALPMPTTTTTTTTTTVVTTTTTVFVTSTDEPSSSTDEVVSSTDEETNTTTGTSQSQATPPAAGNDTIVVITSKYAETFTGGDAVDDWSRPYNSYLPAGTQDKLKAKVYNGSFSYYLLESGKRVYQADAKTVQGKLNKNGALQGGAAVISGIHTKLTFDAAWNIPVYVTEAQKQYYNDSQSGTPNYSIEKYGQTAEYVDLTFHYVTKVPKAPSLKGNPLFSSAKWMDNGGGVWTLRLTLKKAGAYYGYQLEWHGDSLTVSFLNPIDVSKNSKEKKLTGMRILLDPGHGSDDDKPLEGPFNLLYANELKAKLQAMGATVVMTRDRDLGKNGLSLAGRVSMAHAGDYHLVISVHMNGYDGTATGATAHYYDPMAYTAASYIYNKMRAVEVTYGVGTKTNGRPRSSGTVWGTLYMNRRIFDCPSVLLECAFLDNPKDKEALIDPEYRKKLMQAVTDGVVAYVEAM